jgi:hypothetical protein
VGWLITGADQDGAAIANLNGKIQTGYINDT